MDQRTRKGLQLAAGLGIGIGLMAGATVAAFIPRPVLTDAEVMDRARALGMVSVTEMPKVPAVPPRPEPPRTVVIAVVSIFPGMTLTEIGSLLKQAGVIGDDAAFVARGTELQVDGTLKSGVYKLTLDPAAPVTLDQVFELLRKGPAS